MKNTIKKKNFWLVMPVLALAFGMTVIGCDLEPPDNGKLDGTWILNSDNPVTEMKLNDGYFEMALLNISTGARLLDNKGTYTANGEKITFTTTHLYGGGLTALLAIGLVAAFSFESGTFESFDQETWYTKAQIKAKMDAATPSTNTSYAAAISALDDIFQDSTKDYSINGNTLTLTWEGIKDGESVTQNQIYTRKN
jgi:hypothetical protein